MKLGRLNVLTAAALLAAGASMPWLNRARHRPLATAGCHREPGQVLGQRQQPHHGQVGERESDREGRDGLGRHGVGLVIDRQRVEHTGTAQPRPPERPAAELLS